MLVVMKSHATEEQVREVCRKVESLGFRAHPIPGAQRTAIGITGNQGAFEAGTLEEMAGVGEVIRVSKPYKLVSRDVKPDNTVIRFPKTHVTIGGKDVVVIAGGGGSVEPPLPPEPEEFSLIMKVSIRVWQPNDVSGPSFPSQ